MRNVDEQVRKAHGKRTTPINYPQVALVALNPHTGQILAMVGGRNYGVSQLNHAASKRPTGSIFKPFVYAAAENTAVNGQTLANGTFTAITQLQDVPTTFTFDNGRQTYNPGNYKDEYHGAVAAIYALAHSLNNATISLGQQVGFENIAALARASGITAARGTPAVSLGAYDATPIDMAGAYTVFANGGVHLDPWILSSVRSNSGDIVADMPRTAKQVMDPRAAYLTQSLLQGVMDFGYGVEVRKRGFTAPAAGKTGTSHDAWFAAYSSNLICIVWVGNDDYTDVKLSGALAAAPIWAEFMNRAIKLPQYSDVHEFTKPEGVTNVRIDRVTNLPADESCPSTYIAAFLDGTIPTGTCSRMSDPSQNVIEQMLSGTDPSDSTDPNQPDTPKKKKNFFKRLFGGGDPQPKPAPPQ
jgi:penicillin-binding protein 1B